MSRTKSLLTVLASVLLVSMALSGTALADQTNTTTTPTETPTETSTANNSTDESPEEDPEEDSETESEYTIRDLREGGTQDANSPPSVRMTDSGKMWWVVHWPADKPWVEPGEDNKWEFLERGETVGRNSVYLKTILTDTEQQQNVTVHKVYWEKETRTVNNRTVTYATNVTETEQEVEVSNGFVQKEIGLPTHDRPTMVTMWIEGDESDARWVFEHESMETTEDAGIGSMGDYWIQAIQDFLGPIILGLFGAGFLVKRMIERAGIGPQWGYLPWIILLVLVGVVTVFGFYGNLVSVVADAPMLASLFIVGLIVIVMLETYSVGVREVVFLQPKTTDATSPSGEDAVDMLGINGEVHQMIKLDDGGHAVVRGGLFPFLARVFGGVARLEGLSNVKSRVEVDEGDWDEIIYVDADADYVLDYQQEGWQFDFPDEDDIGDLLFNIVALVAGMYSVSTALSGIPMLAGIAAVFGLLFVRPRDGKARIDPAPVHTRSAHASQIAFNNHYDEAKTLDESRERVHSLEARNERDVEQAVDKRDATLVEEMLREDGKQRSIIPDEPGDDDVDHGGDDDE